MQVSCSISVASNFDQSSVSPQSRIGSFSMRRVGASSPAYENQFEADFSNEALLPFPSLHQTRKQHEPGHRDSAARERPHHESEARRLESRQGGSSRPLPVTCSVRLAYSPKRIKDMAPPKYRVRKFHRRSKNGCTTCKKRHVRCDERRPLWYASSSWVMATPRISLSWQLEGVGADSCV